MEYPVIKAFWKRDKGGTITLDDMAVHALENGCVFSLAFKKDGDNLKFDHLAIIPKPAVPQKVTFGKKLLKFIKGQK